MSNTFSKHSFSVNPLLHTVVIRHMAKLFFKYQKMMVLQNVGQRQFVKNTHFGEETDVLSATLLSLYDCARSVYQMLQNLLNKRYIYG